MKPENKKGLFTILYPFMAQLGLAGLAKECFATIFGFWYSQGQHPVGVSLTTMQTITGGTRPAVIQAINKLEKAGLIIGSRIPGKKTIYDVKLPEQTMAEFKELYAGKRAVNTLNHQEYSPKTSTSPPNLPRNNKNPKREPYNTPLKVRTTDGINTGGLKEA